MNISRSASLNSLDQWTTKKSAPSPVAASSSSKTVGKAAKAKTVTLSQLETQEGMAAFLIKQDVERIAEIEALMTAISRPSPQSSISDLTAIVKHFGLGSAEGLFILRSMNALIDGPDLQEGGLSLLLSLMKSIDRKIEPFVFPYFPNLLLLHADRSAPVRDLASHVVKLFAEFMSPLAFRPVLQILLEKCASENDWRIRVAALEVLKILAPRTSNQLSPLLPLIIPQVSECMLDSKKQVQTAGIEAMLEACKGITNEDIKHLVPQLVSVIAKPEETVKTLDALLQTTFVANVDAPTLALIAPLLGKALKGRLSGVKRKAARVIDIMCRLVQNPADVAPFVPLLLPSLERVIDEIVDAEVCEVVKAAREVLLKAMGEGNVAVADPTIAAIASRSGTLEVPETEARLLDSLLQAVPELVAESPVSRYIAQLSAQLLIHGTEPNPTAATEEAEGAEPWRLAVAMAPIKEWKDCIVPYVDAALSSEQKAASQQADEAEFDFCERLSMSFRAMALGPVPDRNLDLDDDGTNVCNIEFSLAFGGKILLHNTRLKLGRGRRYGLMGKNGAGKTTLLTNIGTGNIEGLPPELKMIYVQHDDNSDDRGIALLDELSAHKDIVSANVTREEVETALLGINFTPQMLQSPRSALSGGWAMKVLIIKAMLAKADVLLLDEVRCPAIA